MNFIVVSPNSLTNSTSMWRASEYDAWLAAWNAGVEQTSGYSPHYSYQEAHRVAFACSRIFDGRARHDHRAAVQSTMASAQIERHRHEAH